MSPKVEFPTSRAHTVSDYFTDEFMVAEYAKGAGSTAEIDPNFVSGCLERAELVSKAVGNV